MIKMNTLLETKSGNNVCKLENYDDYVYSGSFWKICQALESYHQKYSQYFYMIWEKAQFIEDKKLDAILD